MSLISLLSALVPASFGRAPEGERLDRIRASSNYAQGRFRNLEPTVLAPIDKSRLGTIGEFIFESAGARRPDRPLPMVATDLKALDRSEDAVVWLGHSSFYLNVAQHSVLIDPVLNSYASPWPFFNRAFDKDYPYSAQEMPDIDCLIISHDHWDHLDFSTVKALKDKVKIIVCPLGVGAHLERWGVEREKIHEIDWFESVSLSGGLKIHALPARHFSGRGAFSRDKTLWASFLLESDKRKIYYSGDSGYGAHFAKIGEKFGGVDLALLENGQYDRRWANVHMLPEDTARAAEDLGARAVLPAHSGRFCISFHAWDDPYRRLAAASVGKNYRFLTPMIGEAVELGREGQVFGQWWAAE